MAPTCDDMSQSMRHLSFVVAGLNGLAWDPRRLNLNDAVLRHPSLAAWHKRRARVDARDPRRALVPL